ncbi:hypothetical protein IFM89_009642 [Coptis chinensis]|uniref:NB-ARC domain-containing protein n=1 Tax=Coptis chinensis TaxID=261450 RepID=A0A835IL69_9MAGN|nr:hypothetical protein IFM89_009642 [Coptis chinensis]
MDDVWNNDGDWWRHISSYLPEGEKCNQSIIITTRNESVAKSMGVTRIHHARKLDETESWDLFCTVAANRQTSKDSEFETVGREIVKKCDGLPLAIKTIGGLLSTKTQSLHQWKQVSKNFRNELANRTSVPATLQLSYDDLPAKLKQCILCFSVYPEDYEISAEQLVYWWVGEGFVLGNEEKTAIEVAFECLLELVNRCLVEAVKQRGYDGRVYKCKMHDMVRDLIIKMAKEAAFCSFDEINKQKPEVNSRHLGYTREMDEKLLENNSKLRAFLLMESCPLPVHRNTGLATVNSLRVLDLSTNKLDSIHVEEMWSWIKSQKRLAYLSLRRISSLEELPDWIRRQQNLQILVITECSNLKRLPSCITTLQSLVVLDVDNCPLQCLPRGLGRLTKLQVLSGFKLPSPGKDGTLLVELKDLTNLRVLRINISKQDEIADDEAESLSKLEQLQILSIDTKDCDHEIIPLMDKLLPPISLQELYLRSYHGDTSPIWLNPSSLPELLYLYIEHGELTSVRTDFWGNTGKPWKIEGLCLKYLPRLEMEWKTVCSKMKYIRYLEVSRCHKLQSFPCNVNNYGVWEKEEEERE